MAKTGSYIKLDRGLKNNALWLSEKPFTKGQAWIDLLVLTQGVDKNREYRGKQKQMKSGNIYTSIYFLAKRWGWNRMKVYRFLEKLMLDEMIIVHGWTIDEETHKASHRGKKSVQYGVTVHCATDRDKSDTMNDTTITIVNWALYQYDDTTDDTNFVQYGVTVHRTTQRTHKRKNTEKEYTEKDTENNPPKSPHRGDSPSGGKKGEPDRESGTYDDIPEKHRDGTYHCFKTYQEYYDWLNQ